MVRKLTEIKIPFNAWSIGKLNLAFKCATSRTKKYGSVGDIFMVDGNTYRLNMIVKLPLWFIRRYLYASEGCENPEVFEAVWNSIHPRKGFDPNQEVWYHHFDCIVAKDKCQQTFDFDVGIVIKKDIGIVIKKNDIDSDDIGPISGC